MASSPLRTKASLAAGMVLGVIMAALGLLRGPAARIAGIGEDTVAVVGSGVISRARFERALAALERDRRGVVADDDKRAVLDRLVDEELLIQRGLALGMAESDRKLRADLVTAVIDVATFDAETREPSPEELARFFESNQDTLGGRATVRLAEVFVGVPANPPTQQPSGQEEDAARRRADSAAERLRGGDPIGEVARDLGQSPAVPLPDSPLPLSKIRDFLGPTAAAHAATLAEGEVSEPVRSADGYHVLVMLERRGGNGTSLDEVREETLREYRRRAGEAALRVYLAGLRAQAAVTVVADPTHIEVSEATRQAATAPAK